MRKNWTPFFFSPEAATGAAGDVVVDDKVGAAVVADDKAVADKAAADTSAADKASADKAAADKEAADKNETPEAKATREAAEQKAADEAKNKPPEKYELKVGEDAAIFIDTEDLKLIEKVARDNGFTNEQAQRLIDDRASALAAQSDAFRGVTETDAVYGGDKLPETQRLAKVALDHLRPAGTPRGDAFRKILSKTGYGNNLEIVSLLADLGKQMAEDSPGGEGGGSSGGGAKKDAATVLYGDAGTKGA